MDAVADAALGLAGVGDLFVHDPVWSPRGSLSPPSPGDPSLGDNGRGEYVTVFVDYSYRPDLQRPPGQILPAHPHDQRGVDPCHQQLTRARGQALAVFALSLTALMLAAALAYDVGAMLLERRDQQNAADAAALAGVRYVLENETKARAAAIDVATANGFTDVSR